MTPPRADRSTRPAGAAEAIGRLAASLYERVRVGAVGGRWMPATQGRAYPATDFDQLIERVASREGIDENLVRAVVEVESGFRPDAVSSAGAIGLMQLMPQTAKSLGVGDPFDPVANLVGGARFLRTLLGRFQSVPLALAAYNAGPAAVEEFGGVPPYAETKAYVSKVLEAQQRNAKASVHERMGGEDGGRSLG